MLHRPSVLAGDALNDVAGVHIGRQDIESVGLDLEMGADAAMQFVEEIRSQGIGGRLERARAVEEERHMEMHAQFLHFGKARKLIEGVRQVVPGKEGAGSGATFHLMQVDGLGEGQERFPAFRVRLRAQGERLNTAIIAVLEEIGDKHRFTAKQIICVFGW